MYKIKCDDLTLYNPLINDLKLGDPTLDLEVNKAGSLSFTIHPTHTHFTQLEKMKSIITVLQNDKTLFKGRIFSDTVNFRKEKKVEVEGLLAYFNDSIVRPYEFTGSVEEYVAFLTNQHNDQVDEHQRFKLGIVTVTDPNDYITRASSDLPNTWSEIEEKLIKSLGGYIVIRYEEDGNYIDYLSDFTDVSTQNIEFAVNLLDLENIVNGDNLATCIIPYGAKIEPVTEEPPEDIPEEDIPEDEEIIEDEIETVEETTEPENETTETATEERVTIVNVNDGVDFIQDDEAVAKYGKIYEVVTWDDVTEPINLLRKAEEYLQTKIKLQNTLTIKAVDLHLTNKDIEAFKLGDYIPVYSNPHEIKDVMLLRSYSLPLTNPAGFTFTLGRESSSFLDDQISVDRETSNTLHRIDVVDKKIDNANTSIDINLEETLEYINEVIENSETFTRTLLEEYSKTSDIEELNQRISTTFAQMAGEISYTFTTLSERITNENGELTRELNELTKYVRIVNGDLELGEVDNPLITRLVNGKLSFVLNGTEVAYISDNKLYITEAEILTSIIIGNFAFVPRTNGNLSFKKVR